MRLRRGSDFVTLRDLEAEDYFGLLEMSLDLKRRWKRDEAVDLLRNRTLAMLFQRPSTRTSISFEAAMTQLGGHAQYLWKDRIWAGSHETWRDTINVLSRLTDGIAARVVDHRELVKAAEYSNRPVINASTDWEHPCQAMADLQTVYEKRHDFRGLRYVFCWGFNSATPPMGLVNSTSYASSQLGMDLVIACPEGYGPDDELLAKVQADAEVTGGSVSVVNDMKEAVRDADVINIYSWIPPSLYRQKLEKNIDHKVPHLVNPDEYRKWIVTQDIVALAKKDALVMHCMPASRNEEVTNEVLDGPQSVIIDEAENRLHAQKAVLALLMG